MIYLSRDSFFSWDESGKVIIFSGWSKMNWYLKMEETNETKLLPVFDTAGKIIM